MKRYVTTARAVEILTEMQARRDLSDYRARVVEAAVADRMKRQREAIAQLVR